MNFTCFCIFNCIFTLSFSIYASNFVKRNNLLQWLIRILVRMDTFNPSLNEKSQTSTSLHVMASLRRLFSHPHLQLMKTGGPERGLWRNAVCMCVRVCVLWRIRNIMFIALVKPDPPLLLTAHTSPSFCNHIQHKDTQAKAFADSLCTFVSEMVGYVCLNIFDNV